MRPLRPIALVAAAAALSACSTVQRVGALLPFGHAATPHNAVPREGRVSILASDQALVADPALASRTIVVPPTTDFANWNQPGGNATNSPPNVNGEATLQQVWRTSLGAGTNGHVTLAAVPVIAQGQLFFIDSNQRVTAVDTSNGRHLWSVVLRPHHSRDHFAEGGGIAVSEGRVFATTGFGFVVALDASNGHEIWRAEGGTPYQSSPTVAGGRVYAITNDSTLLAMDANTGEVQWNFQAIAEPARIVASPSVAVAGDTVIAPFASGELAALVSANGRRLWGDSLSRPGALTSLSAINDIPGRPVVADGVVFAASHSGVLVAININTGQRIWAKPFASAQTPCVIGDVVYAVSVDGELAAFDRATGGVYWVKQLR
ncbi:MAG: PQQ-like beta-propeller repeat protein, partial [Proteobacteria bacterium]|nr:PQQ-like beta-propeller repeat protein [Pseudomonadota bacterium]